MSFSTVDPYTACHQGSAASARETDVSDIVYGQRVEEGAMHEVQLVMLNTIDEDETELSWQERSLCAQTDPEAFFPEKGGLDPGGQEGLRRLRGPGRVPGVRPASTTSGSASGAGCPSASAAS